MIRCHIGHWYEIIVLNVHASTKDKSDSTNDSLYEELQTVP